MAVGLFARSMLKRTLRILGKGGGVGLQKDCRLNGRETTKPKKSVC